MEIKICEANKILFCDCLDNLIVFLTTVTGSHKCLEHHFVLYCAQIVQFFSKKVKYCDSCQVGQVLSPNLGQVLSLLCS